MGVTILSGMVFFVDVPNINMRQDTGPVVAWEASDITLKNLTIQGDPSISWNNNNNGIRIEEAYNVLVVNNTIYDIKSASGPNRNYSGIMTYGAGNVTCEWNKIYNSGSGVFIKGGGVNTGLNNTDIIIQFNLFYDIDSDGVILRYVDGAEVRQNIVRDSLFGVTTWGGGSGVGGTPANSEIFNNTFHNISGSGCFAKPVETGYSNISFYNNIIAGSQNAIQIDFVDLSDIDFLYNLYYNNSNQAKVSDTDYTPAEWTSIFNKDTAGSTFDVDPMFTDEAADDFTLQAGSPGLTAGINGGAVGANDFDPSEAGSCQCQ